MLSVILPRWDEPTVIDLTRENMQRELATLPGSELIVADNWVDGVGRTKHNFVCLIEPDCVVSSGYFNSNLNLFMKNDHTRKLAMVSSKIGLNNWGNTIYGYHLEQVTYGKEIQTKDWEIQPHKDKKSQGLFSIQVGYLPGAIIRRSALEQIIEKFKTLDPTNLVKLSTDICFFLWGTNRRVQVNPNSTYVSTQEYLSSPSPFKWGVEAPSGLFEREMI